jgi:phosphate transport system permease protein
MQQTETERPPAAEAQSLRSVYYFERLFKGSLSGMATMVLLVIGGIFLTLLYHAFPSIREFGLQFIVGREWNVVTGEFSALPFIVGTLLSSFLALLISLPFSLAIALFLGEYYRTGWLAALMQNMVELLAGIPSVVYGLWGLFVLVPLVRSLQFQLGVMPWGVGILTASLVLAIMITPYSAAMAREVIRMAPSDLKEGAYALGATRFEVIWSVVLPYTRSGIIAGVLLSLGRALGETMAVTMVIGNANYIPTSIFSPANTMASLIANEFTEATGEVYIASIIYIALLLFLISCIINLTGRYVISRWK